VEDAEDSIYHQDLTDMADMLIKKIMGSGQGKTQDFEKE